MTILLVATSLCLRLFGCAEVECTASNGAEIIDAVRWRCYQAVRYKKGSKKGEPIVITPSNQFTDSLIPFDDGFVLCDTQLLQNPEVPPDAFKKITPVKTFEGPFLSFANDPAVRIGDIILIHPAKSTDASGKKIPPLILFYAGEETFPGLGSKTLGKLEGQDPDGGDKKLAHISFFLFPYIAGFEWNTFPPRQHRSLRKYLFDRMSFWDKLVAWTKRVFNKGVFAWNPDSTFKYVHDHRRNIHWLNTKTTENYCGVFHKDSHWCSRNGKNSIRLKYQVFRVPDTCEFITLKRRFPAYHQIDSNTTCFFAAYSQVAMYQMHHDDKATDTQLVRGYETRLIRSLVTSPVSNDFIRSSDFFRGRVLFMRGDTENHGNVRWNDSALNYELARNMHLDYLAENCFWDRASALGLQEVEHNGVGVTAAWTQDQLFEGIKQFVANDTPLMMQFTYNGIAYTDVNDVPIRPWRDIEGIRLLVRDGKRLSNHWVPIVGVRECGKKRYVHIAWSNGDFCFLSLENAHEFVVNQLTTPKLVLRGIRIPSNWKKGGRVDNPGASINVVNSGIDPVPRLVLIRKGQEMFRK